MTGPEHYQQAQFYLVQVEQGRTPDMVSLDDEGIARHLAKAQVHATLAHAAAVIDAAGPDVDTVHGWRGVSYP